MLDLIKDQLECPVEMRRYEETGDFCPISLICGHTLSKVAFERVHKRAWKMGQNAVCPTCRVPLAMHTMIAMASHGGSDKPELPRNYEVVQMLSVIDAQEARIRKFISRETAAAVAQERRRLEAAQQKSTKKSEAKLRAQLSAITQQHESLKAKYDSMKLSRNKYRHLCASNKSRRSCVVTKKKKT